MSLEDFNDAMDTGVEYLYLSDTEHDGEETKCGEIFVSFSSFDYVFLCIICKNQLKYSSFDDFVEHVKEEHVRNEHDAKSTSPTDGLTAGVVEEDVLTYEDSSLEASVIDELELVYSDEAKETAHEESETLELAAGYAENRTEEFDFYIEIDEKDCEQEGNTNQWEDRVSYRQCITELLDMYRKCIGLWHKKTADNTSEAVKSDTLKFLLDKYSTYYPECNLNDLQNLLNVLTKRFDTELENEDDCQSKPRYLNHLMFLRLTNDDEISDEKFNDFDCPSCRHEGSSSEELWTHIIKNHLKAERPDPLLIEPTQKLFTLQWPEKNILQFIDLYREQECLWNLKSRLYHNRSLKANAYRTIIDKFNAVNPDALKDREAVKETIRHLRDYFGRINKKQKSSNPLGLKATTMPGKRFKIYKQLLFLENVYIPRRTPSTQACICELCCKTFSKKRDLNAHTKDEHPDARYTCDKCPLVFRSQFNIAKHRKEHARDDGKTYACPICHANFENSDGLATHLNEHLPTNLQKQICEICGAKFDDRSNLLIHIRRHTNTKNYTCNFCHKGFVTSTELKSHVVVHSNDRPFVCEFCGLRFKYSNRLNTHRLIHGDPKFKCDDCDMKFVSKRNLIDHQRTHAPVVKVSCDICGSLFRNRDSLSRHRRKIHNIKMREQSNMVVC